MLNPSSISPSAIIQRADAIWKRRGIRPKQHLSEPRPGAVTLMEKRAHADRCSVLPRDLPDDMGKMEPFLPINIFIGPLDLMIEVHEYILSRASTHNTTQGKRQGASCLTFTQDIWFTAHHTWYVLHLKSRLLILMVYKSLSDRQT